MAIAGIVAGGAPWVVGHVGTSWREPMVPAVFLLDTGADVSAINRDTATMLGLDIASLPTDDVRGWGGSAPCGVTGACLRLIGKPPIRKALELRVSADPELPCVLGQDVISDYTLLYSQRGRFVFLLDEREARHCLRQGEIERLRGLQERVLTFLNGMTSRGSP